MESKWAYKIRKTKENADYIPSWYKCPKCGIEFQDTPPTHRDDGNNNQLCPDCGGAFDELPKGYGLGPDVFTNSLESIERFKACGCYDIVPQDLEESITRKPAGNIPGSYS